MIAEALQARRGEEFEVLPENAAAVQAMQAAGTQWKIHPNGLPHALDYAGASVVWRFERIRLTAEDFAKLRVLENTVIETLRDKHAQPQS